MTSKFTIRPAGNSDCCQVAEIYQESLDRVDSSMEVRTSARHFEEQLAGFHDREVMLVLETVEGLQGYGVVKQYSDRIGYRVACETSIYFRRSATGQGYGGALQQALLDVLPFCRQGARLVVMSYHSLEDRIVKDTIKADPRLSAVTKKPVMASPSEVAANPRARSARLRIAETVVPPSYLRSQ